MSALSVIGYGFNARLGRDLPRDFFSSIKTLITNNLEGQNNSVWENTGNLVILSKYIGQHRKSGIPKL